MLSVEEALEEVAAAAGAPRLRAERVRRDEAVGRFLAEDVVLGWDEPSFRRAAMDGFALRAQDAAPGRVLPVCGRVVAGDWPAPSLDPGSAMRITTGAPLPEAADAVVPVEWTEPCAEGVRIDRAAAVGAHVIERGAHARAGDVVLGAGVRLGPGAIGALAGAGLDEVGVAGPPDVAVLATGSELQTSPGAPGKGRVPNSNGAMLAAQVRRAGGRPRDLGVAPDDAEALAGAVRRGLAADLLLLSGGVSRGELDLVPEVLAREGVQCRFHRWAVQPGGPLWFGVREETLVFALPGNPAAVFVGFEILGVPALGTRLGRPFTPRPSVRVRYAGPWGRASPRRRFRPATLHGLPDGGLEARAAPWTGSGDPFAAARAAALVALPEGRPAPGEGRALVDAFPLEWPA